MNQHVCLLALSQRLGLWLSLIAEYPHVCKVFKEHLAEGFFQYGAVPRHFKLLGEHVATKQLLDMRRTPKAGPFSSAIRWRGDGPVLPTYLPVEEGAAAALGAAALAAADLFEARTGRAQQLDVRQSGSGLMTASYLYMYAQPSGEWKGCDGYAQTIAAEGSVKPQRKAYECKDGRWIFLHGGFPKLKKGLTDFLRCQCTVEEMSAACMKWNAGELETAMQRKGLAATKCRTPMEWRASPQGQVIGKLPPLCFERRRGGFHARPLPRRCARPLSDVIVLDFSHVIASPVVGRTLADHGATVIKVISQDRPRRELFDVETNHGKAPLTIELNTPEGKRRLWDLLKVADVVIDGYTQGVLPKLGFSRRDVLARNPHLVYLKTTCFGHVGPLAHGKGFQQNANFAAGVASIDDEQLMGYQLVSQIDYATGFLGAYGVILALIDRELSAQVNAHPHHPLSPILLAQTITVSRPTLTLL